MERREKVFWENEAGLKVRRMIDHNKPFGIYYYLDEDIVGVEWFSTESERDAEYDKYSCEAA